MDSQDKNALIADITALMETDKADKDFLTELLATIRNA